MNEFMSAVTIDAFGPPDVLQVTEMPTPTPGVGEVLIRVAAASVNPVDWKTRMGRGVARLVPGFPHILGWDVSGVVVDVGPESDGLRVGDAVYGMLRFPEPGRAYAEYVTAPIDHVAPKPASLDHAQSAALPLAGLTAWQALFDEADVQPGQRVLVHGAAGGVGHLVVQLAKWRGAEVLATASARNAEFVRGLGSDEVIDYRAASFEQQLSAVDVVIDCVGGDIVERSLAVLKRGGVLVTLPTKVDWTSAEQAGVRAVWCLVHPDRAQLTQLADLADRRIVRPHVERRFGLAELPDAHRISESGHGRGKLVISVADGPA